MMLAVRVRIIFGFTCKSKMESKNYHLFLGMYTQWRLSSVRCAVLISKLIQKSLADINFVQINNNIDL
jgi:hypothetical protein